MGRVMLSAGLFIGFFFLAFALDAIAVLYHTARESDDVPRTIGFACSLELLGWVPLWVVIEHHNWWIAGACVAGSGAGVAYGMFRVRRIHGKKG